MTNRNVPHLGVVIAVTCFVLFGFAAVSVYAVVWSTDEVTKGNIIGTWINFAVLAVGFWIGSSSGGKAATGHTPDTATGRASDPVHIVPEQKDPLDLTGLEEK